MKTIGEPNPDQQGNTSTDPAKGIPDQQATDPTEEAEGRD
jgi:hypothetical protein